MAPLNQTRPPSLDASWYPHLVDAVFAHADEETLILLRGASRSFKARAEAILAYHIRMPLTHHGISVTTLDGSCFPGLPWNRGHIGYAPPPWHVGDADNVGYRDILRHVRVLDAVMIDQGSRIAASHTPHPSRVMLRALNGVHTLRHTKVKRPNDQMLWAAAVPSKRVVIFLHIFLVDEGLYFPVDPVAHGVEKLVIHITDYGTGDEKGQYHDWGCPDWPTTLRHVVFIFASKGGTMPRRGWLPHQRLGILRKLLLYIAVTIPDIKYTFVDMRTVTPILFNLHASPPTSDPHAKDIIVSEIVQLKAGTAEGTGTDLGADVGTGQSSVWPPMSDSDCERIADVVDKAITVCSFEDYAATLSPDDLALETEQGRPVDPFESVWH